MQYFRLHFKLLRDRLTPVYKFLFLIIMIHNNLCLYELKKFECLPTKLTRSEYLQILFAPIWSATRELNRKDAYRKYISCKRKKIDDAIEIHNVYKAADSKSISELTKEFSKLQPAENLDFELLAVTDRCRLLALKQELENLKPHSLWGFFRHPLKRWSLVQSIRFLNCRSYPLVLFIQMGMRRYLNEKWGSREDFLKDFSAFANSEQG